MGVLHNLESGCHLLLLQLKLGDASGQSDKLLPGFLLGLGHRFVAVTAHLDGHILRIGYFLLKNLNIFSYLQCQVQQLVLLAETLIYFHAKLVLGVFEVGSSLGDKLVYVRKSIIKVVEDGAAHLV